MGHSALTVRSVVKLGRPRTLALRTSWSYEGVATFEGGCLAGGA